MDIDIILHFLLDCKMGIIIVEKDKNADYVSQ